ncbi:P-type DNA transfer ATPase VirB11 [Buttiauxella sp. B2]|uniref:P-type DNA transfer ATPase VirB11 n=1 Tax=Buttiauxella sp. B2 TaxID=2587812 RepID=UPI001120E2D9|nr:P-type DNA transfer ATPase VirB11 [Buttiauxella sp. B2]TNV16102.1 P-type DNA transfer ATPase VirB11 [Buttiauxella sp. B2]
MEDDKSDLARLYLAKTGIQDLLDVDGITEVAVNQPGKVWFESSDGWKFVEQPAANFENLKHLAESLSTYSNLPGLNQENPIASVILPGGERGQIIMPPATEPGCIVISIRKPSLKRFSIADYVASGRFDNVRIAQKQTVELTERQKYLYTLYLKGDANSLEQFLYEAVKERLNFLIVGGTGSGKTTLAKAVADIFPPDRRYATIEDVHEMQLPNHPNHIHLFYKKGVITSKTIIEACMRLKPDHIFLAELRGDEAWSYLEALNTGHEGSISTIHANNTYASFSRLASIVKQSDVGMTVDMNLIMKTIKTSVDVILFFNRTYLTEIYFEPEEKNRLLNES